MNALLVISGLGIASLIAEIANFKKALPIIILAGLAAASGLIFLDWDTGQSYFNDMLVFDVQALAFSGLISVAALFWFWMSVPYFSGDAYQTDRTSLVMFVVAGGLLLCSFNNMAMLFLGIEILSIPLYVLAGARKDNLLSTEAAFKYFLMGSFATGFLLFGIALVYGATGSFDLAQIASAVSSDTNLPGFLFPGILMMLVGLAFKISAVPFHFWAPDVYDGAPTTITALMSTVVKIAAIAAFVRIFSTFDSVRGTWFVVLQVMMILTLVVPNITAVYQSSVKRMLAYSSIGHVGFLLLAYTSVGPSSTGILVYYLTAYSFASLCAFAILTILERETGSTGLDAFKGLSKSSPLLAFAMTVALMSLAGIPPLSGFFGKYMVLSAAVAQGYVAIAILAVMVSLVGVYYYFRVIVAMYFGGPSGEHRPVPLATTILILLLVLAIIGVGLFPDMFVIRV
jgi:NADH-quinone oxidoreductase subunit N